jgi:hypothetical protein
MEEPINDEYIRQRYSRELPRENIDNLKRAMDYCKIPDF